MYPLEPEELRSVVDIFETQQDVMAGHPKDRLYIDSGAFVHILFNQELFKGLIQLGQVINIQADGK